MTNIHHSLWPRNCTKWMGRYLSVSCGWWMILWSSSSSVACVWYSSLSRSSQTCSWSIRQCNVIILSHHQYSTSFGTRRQSYATYYNICLGCWLDVRRAWEWFIAGKGTTLSKIGTTLDPTKSVIWGACSWWRLGWWRWGYTRAWYGLRIILVAPRQGPGTHGR